MVHEDPATGLRPGAPRMISSYLPESDMKQIDTIYINGKLETPHGRERLTLIDGGPVRFSNPTAKRAAASFASARALLSGNSGSNPVIPRGR